MSRPGPSVVKAPTPARVTMLGTGTSHGVPMIGCNCVTCRSTDVRDRRLRPSIYIDIPNRAQILVDTATDLRQQALMHGITVGAGRIRTNLARDQARDNRAGVEKHEVAGIGDTDNVWRIGE